MCTLREALKQRHCHSPPSLALLGGFYFFKWKDFSLTWQHFGGFERSCYQGTSERMKLVCDQTSVTQGSHRAPALCCAAPPAAWGHSLAPGGLSGPAQRGWSFLQVPGSTR